MKEYIFIALALVILGSLFYFALVPEVEAPLEEEVSLYSKLSLRDKAGQMLLIGFEGREVTPELTSLIKEVRPGGILLLGRNIESADQVQEMVSRLQELSVEQTGLPLFVAVDQEGGIVSRFPWVESTPQSELRDTDHAYSVGSQRAQELLNLGVNMNLAPVLDSRGVNDFVYTRFFQEDTIFSSMLAKSLIAGHEDNGVIAVPKHFPGCDGVSFNPENNIIPSVRYAPNISIFSMVHPLDVIMVSHVIYENTDNVNPYPFSVSGIGGARTLFGPDTVIMSDDLLSKAFMNVYSLEEIGRMAVLSGVDVLLVAGYPEASTVRSFADLLLDVVVDDIELQAQVEESAERIVKLKEAIVQ